MFTVPSPFEPLTQGDLFEDCPLVSLLPDPVATDIAAIPVQRWYSRVIALTQACDLAQPRTDLVLVAPVHTAERLVDRGRAEGKRHPRSTSAPFGVRLVFLARNHFSRCLVGIDHRSARPSFRPAHGPGTAHCGRETAGKLVVAVPRAPGPASCRHLHAGRLA
jgi:hypothetical protein